MFHQIRLYTSLYHLCKWVGWFLVRPGGVSCIVSIVRIPSFFSQFAPLFMGIAGTYGCILPAGSRRYLYTASTRDMTVNVRLTPRKYNTSSTQIWSRDNFGPISDRETLFARVWLTVAHSGPWRIMFELQVGSVCAGFMFKLSVTCLFFLYENPLLWSHTVKIRYRQKW